jgi:integrase
VNSFSAQELSSLLAAARKHSQRDYVMILCGFFHGMRATEICALTAEHVIGGHVKIERLKGSETNIQQGHADMLAYCAGKTGPLFNIKRRQFHNVIRKHGTTAGIAIHKLSAHKLKHTTAHLMLEGGATINTVQKRLGHKNGGNTLKYLAVSDEVADKAFASAAGGLL